MFDITLTSSQSNAKPNWEFVNDPTTGSAYLEEVSTCFG